MDYGQRLKMVRGPILQEDFAKILDVHKNTLVRFETGKGKPNIEELNRILAAFPDINPAWLLTGEGEMKRGKRGLQAQADHIADAGKVMEDKQLYSRPKQPHAWFHEWIDEELRGKSISDIMAMAVKIKTVLDEGREK